MESSFPNDVLLGGDKEEECDETHHERPNYRQEKKMNSEVISTLPRIGGLLGNYSVQLSQYQGFWHWPYLLESIMSAQQHFKAQPTDIILSSAPKTGTTWLKALSFAIVTRDKFDYSASPLLTNNPHDCVPFLEVDLVGNQTKYKPLCAELPLLATHIPYTSLPESIVASDCKIVYIWRDAKDAFVSLWHFIRKVLPKEVEVPFEDVFDHFCKGVSFYGPYWEHILGYWRASLERPGRILFLKYEDVKRNTYKNVKILAEFLGCPFSVEEEKEGAVEKIIDLCSFNRLSNLDVNKSGKHRPETQQLAVDKSTYFRSGNVGDWENHLTAEMKQRLDQVMENKLKGSGLDLN